MREKTWKSATTSAALSALFLLLYGFCNWVTSHRVQVGTINFSWERHLPFVPVFILPYLSIDLFFVLAPFMCRSEAERRTLAKRVVAAIVVASICFLLFPLRFAFARPSPNGFFAEIVEWFTSLDRPYNLFPSLHIGLLVIIAQVYLQNAKGWWRGIIIVWFGLIAGSTLLTYQHHLLDVIGGLALAICCYYFFRETLIYSSLVPNYRVGACYLSAALVTAATAISLWPWGALLLWPSLAVGLVATGYFKMGASVYRKEDGRLHWSAVLLLAPCLLGQRLSLFYYRSKCRIYDKLYPNIWIGRALNEREGREIVAAGVTAVLDLTAEFSRPKAFCSIPYRSIPVLDLTAPTVSQLYAMAGFIAEQRSKGIVYVHCKAGYSRSAAALAAYALASGATGSDREALELVKRARPTIVIRPEIVKQLRFFQTDLMKMPESSGLVI